MAEYYLISQLPSLDLIGQDTTTPITEERFLELCSRFLSRKTLIELQRITLIPSINPEKSSSPLIQAWNDSERNLRFALGKARADKMNKSFHLQNNNLSMELLKVANHAVEIENPLEAEKFLFLYRISFLETLRPMDNFSEEFIYYYALKLKLILQIQKFDTKLGEITYKDIYNSILSGDRLEA